jgi:hypothetical protein
MRIFPPRIRNKPIDRPAAVKCLVFNLFATPGLGSWIANRTVPAIGQLILAFSGFFLIIAWFVQLEWGMFQSIMSDDPADNGYVRMGKIGATLFILAWIWSFFTSMSVRTEAKRNELLPKPPQPPVQPQPPIIPGGK